MASQERLCTLILRATTTASTALEFFLDGVRRFGWPYKVRADQGVENVQIAEMIFNVRGTGCGSFISGKSVHNQRIERLRRDVWTGVTHLYYDVLHSLEEDGFLNFSDSLHLFCAHCGNLGCCSAPSESQICLRKMWQESKCRNLIGRAQDHPIMQTQLLLCPLKAEDIESLRCAVNPVLEETFI
ncbi:hypothetical protein AMECASPLE_015578 [Ameca splendens]|uniref:Integrase core domain-containing protein n=1 Tax=Ameca splendens TaxID=208324 RepID=A0ABV0Y1X1_9TELE